MLLLELLMAEGVITRYGVEAGIGGGGSDATMVAVVALAQVVSPKVL